LRNEIQHVENYLIIQQMRYSDILQYAIDADGEVLDSIVLKLLLQPLVENAIYHGIRKKRGGRGLVSVSAKNLPDGISFRVSDTGVGMMPETLSRTRALMREGPGDTGDGERKSGYGLFNVNRRLELYYGAECGLSVESGTGGTTVSFRLPKSPPPLAARGA
ncbi:MAG: hypothetical protein LBG12_04525, partial [Synergistaceae bacterium]|nr:hypothetical protein [Synergistaceae bacterium]